MDTPTNSQLIDTLSLVVKKLEKVIKAPTTSKQTGHELAYCAGMITATSLVLEQTEKKED